MGRAAWCRRSEKMCEINLTTPMQTARVNTTKVSVTECIELLTEEGFQVEASEVIPEGIKVLKGNIAHSSAFEKGLLTIQDESSMIVAYALDLDKPYSVLMLVQLQVVNLLILQRR